jgi:colicin import membrane protein
LQKTASLGTPTGDAPKLSPSMRDALAGLLKDQVQKCFDIPPGMDESKIQQAQVRVVFNQDGSLAGRPLVASSSSDPGVRAVAGALQRAIMRCAPYRIPAQFLPTFNDWKDTLFTPPDSLG